MYGEFIRRVRESRGLSQPELARIVGISQPNLSAYERDRRAPGVDTLNRIVVGCGYELAATDGSRTLHCPLPAAGWFPDEGDPPRHSGDPAEEPPLVTADTPMAKRLEAITAALRLAEATR